MWPKKIIGGLGGFGAGKFSRISVAPNASVWNDATKPSEHHVDIGVLEGEPQASESHQIDRISHLW